MAGLGVGHMSLDTHMKLYYGGAEVPSHRQWLQDAGVTHVYLSYMGLRRRIRRLAAWRIADKIPPGMHVLLDSGCHTINKKEDHDLAELAEIAAGYEEFVAANVSRVDAFTEFDALPLGFDWIMDRREELSDLHGDKLMPVFHNGGVGLDALVSRFRHVGILHESLGDRDLAPVLNMYAARRGTQFHGMGITRPSLMQGIRWDSVGSTSWLSPMRFGDTFVWTGKRLRRYPRAYKDQARKRHRSLFLVNGFDAAKIANDDPREIVRLSLWSWQQLVENINSHNRPKEVVLGEPSSGGPADITRATPVARPRILLPGIRLTKIEGSDDAHLELRGDNLRLCDTCFLRDRGCPGYQAGASCVYELPIEIKTPAQIRTVENALIKIQTDRVLFMKMAEDLEGGYADPNLSSEIDRLSRMIKNQRDGTMIKEKLVFESNRPGEVGAISRIFGKEAADAQAIEAPNAVDAMIREAEIFEAEVVE